MRKAYQSQQIFYLEVKTRGQINIFLPYLSLPKIRKRHRIPIKKDSRPNVCVRQGISEYPCSNNYAGRRNENEAREETKMIQSES